MKHLRPDRGRKLGNEHLELPYARVFPDETSFLFYYINSPKHTLQQ